MTDKQTPPDWVLIEAARKCGWDMDAAFLRKLVNNDTDEVFRALCDMIQKHEQQPYVDRKTRCAKEASKMAEGYANAQYVTIEFTKQAMYSSAFRAIELWEEGFGK